jgi:hypothetical protein
MLDTANLFRLNLNKTLYNFDSQSYEFRNLSILEYLHL